MYAEYEELEVSVVDMTDVHMLSLDTPHPCLILLRSTFWGGCNKFN